MEFILTFLGIAALTPLMLIVGLGLLLAVTVGTAYDRRTNRTRVFWISVLALIGYAFWVAQPTVPGLVDTLTSMRFWAVIGGYVLIGLLYAFVLELGMELRRSKRYFTTRWEDFANHHIRKSVFLTERGWAEKNQQEEAKKTGLKKVAAGISDAIIPPASIEHLDDVKAYNSQHMTVNELKERFTSSNGREWGRSISLTLEEGEIVPTINKAQLVGNVLTWTLFWPFYAISLVIGDLLFEIVDFIAERLHGTFTRIVRSSFAGSFKV